VSEDTTEENVVWSKSWNIADITTLGICRGPASKAIKNALSLAERPQLKISGKRIPGTDNVLAGTLVLFLDFVPSQTQIDAITAALIASPACDTDDRDRLFKLSDLNEIAKISKPGDLFYIKNLARLTGLGSGCLVYKGTNGTFYRLSNDEAV